jgi:hypothetical protein
VALDDDVRPTRSQLERLAAEWRALPARLVGPMWHATRSVACRNGAPHDGACPALVYVTGG